MHIQNLPNVPDYEEKEQQNPVYRRFMSNLHLAMGMIFLIFGGVVIYTHQFGFIELEPWKAYAMGTLLLLYGTFRIWRGYTDLQSLRRNRRH